MILKGMNKEEKKRVLGEVVGSFIEGLSREEKRELINRWLERFFEDMTTEDKQKVVEDIMPKIKDGFNTALILPQMLTALMGQYDNSSPMMPTMFLREAEDGSSDEDKGSQGENATDEK
jgi:hypothetical protein